MSQPTFSISTKDREPVLDIGKEETMRKSQQNKQPLPLPSNFLDVVHIDIVFGVQTAIGGIFYKLFIVDRKTRSKFIYLLCSLHHDIHSALD